MKRLAGPMGLLLMFATSLPAAALQEGQHVHSEGPHNEVFTVGKSGEVKIGQDVTIGDVLVKKGKYMLTHRAEGSSHLLILTRIDSPKNSTEALVHEIRTRLEPSADSVKRSAFFAYQLPNGSYRVPVVQIVGEGGNHIPESVDGA